MFRRRLRTLNREGNRLAFTQKPSISISPSPSWMFAPSCVLVALNYPLPLELRRRTIHDSVFLVPPTIA